MLKKYKKIEWPTKKATEAIGNTETNQALEQQFNKKLINAYIFITDLDKSTELKLENDLV